MPHAAGQCDGKGSGACPVRSLVPLQVRVVEGMGRKGGGGVCVNQL